MIVLPATSMTFAPAGTAVARARTDGGDAVAVDDDGAVLDDLVAVHGDDARAGERELAGRDVGRLA